MAWNIFNGHCPIISLRTISHNREAKYSQRFVFLSDMEKRIYAYTCIDVAVRLCITRLVERSFSYTVPLRNFIESHIAMRAVRNQFPDDKCQASLFFQIENNSVGRDTIFFYNFTAITPFSKPEQRSAVPWLVPAIIRRDDPVGSGTRHSVAGTSVWRV